MKRYLGIVVCLCVVSMIGMEASAQIHISGLLRDEYALGLTPTIKSAGMGGAYIGVDRNYSMNPAALGGIEQIEGTLTYGLYDHDYGPMAHRGRLDVAFHDPFSNYIAEWFPALEFVKTTGVRLMVDGLASDGEGKTRVNPFSADFDSFTIGGHFGVDIFEWLSIGGGAYPYEKANMEFSAPGVKWDGDALSQIGSTQMGLLIKPCKYFNLGAEYIYIKDDLEVGINDLNPATPTHMGDYYYINYFGMGVSIMPLEGTLIAVDYWNGEIEGRMDVNTPFDQDIDRWNLGIEQRVCQYCDLRLGSNNGGLTAGFTVHINDKMDLDYAYVNQALRDKEGVFGDTQYHGLAFTMRF